MVLRNLLAPITTISLSPSWIHNGHNVHTNKSFFYCYLKFLFKCFDFLLDIMRIGLEVINKNEILCVNDFNSLRLI